MQQPIRIPRPADDATLPAFAALTAAHIVMPADAATLASAIGELLACPCVGFDTESRPTFRVGEVSTGPHLIQLATPTQAYLFQVAVPGCVEAARTILQAPDVLKIGFGLKADRSRLRGRLGIELANWLDLGTVLRYQDRKGQVGLRGAVAGVLGARIHKSRRVTTSNWASAELSEAQQAYAANDAYAALQVFLGLPAEQQRLLLQLAGAPPQARRAKPGQPLHVDGSR